MPKRLVSCPKKIDWLIYYPVQLKYDFKCVLFLQKMFINRAHHRFSYYLPIFSLFVSRLIPKCWRRAGYDYPET